MRTERYMGYSSLPLHKWFVLVDKSSLKQKFITDLWCTHKKTPWAHWSVGLKHKFSSMPFGFTYCGFCLVLPQGVWLCEVLVNSNFL